MNYPVSSEQKLTRSALAEQLVDVIDQPGTVWLDTGMDGHEPVRKSLLAYRPAGEICYRDNHLTVRQGWTSATRHATILDALEALDRAVASGAWAVGFISYEATLPLLGLPRVSGDSRPDLHFYLYDCVHEYEAQLDLSAPAVHDTVLPRDPVQCPLSKADYLKRVSRIKEYIREGDIYQANFTCRFEAGSSQHPFAVYQRLRESSPAPHAGYMNFGDFQILSASPERMLYRDGSYLLTSPIKGTVHRGDNPVEENKNETLLLQSEKDLAEHLMIVDLERNDLGMIAEIGSVRVESLYRPERYASVIHLVSDVSARIKSDLPMSKVFSAMLPGGSITGAPKRRAVEIIQELEATPRGIYTGCIGYIHKDQADFNIAIRTLVYQNGKYHMFAGGGIVADSKPEAEYEEMILKASGMFKALGIAQRDLPCS